MRRSSLLAAAYALDSFALSLALLQPPLPDSLIMSSAAAPATSGAAAATFDVPPTHRLHGAYSHPLLRTWAGEEPPIQPSELVFPLFVHDLADEKHEIKALPEQFRWGVNRSGRDSRARSHPELAHAPRAPRGSKHSFIQLCSKLCSKLPVALGRSLTRAVLACVSFFF